MTNVTKMGHSSCSDLSETIRKTTTAVNRQISSSSDLYQIEWTVQLSELNRRILISLLIVTIPYVGWPIRDDENYSITYEVPKIYGLFIILSNFRSCPINVFPIYITFNLKDILCYYLNIPKLITITKFPLSPLLWIHL